MGIFYAVTNRNSRKLSQNADDLHGSSRWANSEDVQNTGLWENRQGVYVGGWRSDGSSRLHYLRHDGPEHILAFAPTRSGKGVGLVIPTLLAWEESVIVYDIKGENWAKTAGFRDRIGNLCFKFSPVEEGASARFNPLGEVRLFTPRDVSDAQNIANMIIRTGEDSPQERYWQDAASSIATGMILHVCYEKALSGRVACLADLAHVFTRPGASFRETLEELMNFEHDPGFQHGWHMPNGDRTNTHPVVKEKVQEMLDKDDKDFGGVLSTAKTALTLYSDPLVANNTAASDFSIDDLTEAGQSAPLKRAGVIVAVSFISALLIPAMLGLRLNSSPSLPVGIYIVTSDPAASLVEFCPPEPYAALALERGYRERGNCSDGGAPLMKPIAARAGDSVELSESGIKVNEAELPNSAPLASDTHGRALKHWPFGTYRVRPGNEWLISSFSPRSFDSRYFGPIRMAMLRDRVQPILTFR